MNIIGIREATHYNKKRHTIVKKHDHVFEQMKKHPMEIVNMYIHHLDML